MRHLIGALEIIAWVLLGNALAHVPDRIAYISVLLVTAAALRIYLASR